MHATSFNTHLPALTKRSWSVTTLILSTMLLLLLCGCDKKNHSTQPTGSPEIPLYEFEATGEDYLISALDEINTIADWPGAMPGSSSYLIQPSLPTREKKVILQKSATDTVYIYGEITPNGYGATVTERFGHPKGILLITVRKTYGMENGHMVTQTKRYISREDYIADSPQQSTLTELYGLSADTIVTHLTRNGTLETYTFRLPVVTRVVNPQDGSIRVTSRYGANGAIWSEIRDGNGVLQQSRRTYGLDDGSLISRTQYPDNSWRQVQTLGQADGTILRVITSSE